jgi:hypothetical protein
VCDGVDDDCDGTPDDGASDQTPYWLDRDRDGFGDPATAANGCSPPAESVGNDDDCDDTNAGVYPGAIEVCDDIDQDCDSVVDDSAIDAPTWYVDADRDLDGQLARIRAEVRIPNAIDFTTDGSQFFFCDTRSRTIEIAAYDPETGIAGPPRPFAQFAEPGAPDGSCMDAEGGLWVAVIDAGRIERFRPDGTLEGAADPRSDGAVGAW